ncbi:uncharacterized protein LOC112093980 [Morus notabilis]|uniref:uncharacterized protein LOC112093980 n=1 Tax=Morus notabilis TaxID=981085 RepID=UPI000CED4775|nr:uncharacterized protein LOC112093980 [Morus notabilis]
MVDKCCQVSFNGVCLFMLEVLKPHNLELFCVLAWSIWKDRNNLVHNDISKPLNELLEDASLYLAGFQRCRVINSAPTTKVSAPTSWSAPPTGELKLNVDAAVVEQADFFSTGGVIPNSNGVVLGAFCRRHFSSVSPFIAKGHAMRDGLLFAAENGWRIQMVETDALKVVSSVKTKCFSGLHDPGLLTGVAHTLARFGLANDGFSSWVESLPSWLSSFVCTDFLPV